MLVTENINKLRNTNSSNEKLEILKSISNDTKEFLRLCYNPRITFGIKQIPEYTHKGGVSLAECMKSLVRNFATRKLTGNSAIHALKELLEVCDENELLECLVKRDAKCGVNVSLLNKAFGKDFIKEIPCMLAQPYNEKTIKNIKFPAIAQEKADGMRCIIIRDEYGFNFFSRNGSPLDLPHIRELLLQYENNNKELYGIIDCEIIGIKNGEILSRQISNGLCNKLIRNTIKEDELKMLGIQVWDFIKENENKIYKDRFDEVSGVVEKINNPFITLINSKIVNNIDEARIMFKDMLKQNKEGIILKNLSNVWENKRSKDLVKFKEELSVDLKVIDVIEGDGDFKGGLGALVCESADGLLRVNVGTGFSLEDRGLQNDLSSGKKVIRIIRDFKDTKEFYMGKIVEVMYNAIIEDKNSNIKSLFLPRLLKIRDDKNIANRLDEI